MPKTASDKREFLQQCETYSPGKHLISEWYISAKLDGTRCFWDGGLSRGVKTDEVPWASILDPRTGTKKLKWKPEATGLWSRYGNPIAAPDWFLNQLPCIPLDGELWAGPGNFQECVSIVKRDVPDDRWKKISFAVYGSPPFTSVFRDGKISNANFLRQMKLEECEGFVRSRIMHFKHFRATEPGSTFEEELLFLRDRVWADGTVFLHRQVKLPADPVKAVEYADRFLTGVLSEGGEGAIIRDPRAVWTPRRVHTCVKWKPVLDAEGKLVGYTTGRDTAKGGKHRGKIGALILDFQGKRLELSGLTDAERAFLSQADQEWAWKNPGVDVPGNIEAEQFVRGQDITFQYRELTKDGVPKEARYLRVRPAE
jgi:DNA ligase-1